MKKSLGEASSYTYFYVVLRDFPDLILHLENIFWGYLCIGYLNVLMKAKTTIPDYTVVYLFGIKNLKIIVRQLSHFYYLPGNMQLLLLTFIMNGSLL